MNKKTTKKKIKTKKSLVKISTFDKITSKFVSNIESLEASMPLVLKSLNDNVAIENKKFTEFIKKFKVNKKGRKSKGVELKVEDMEKLKNFAKKLHSASIAQVSIPRSLFILMVSHLDNLLRGVIKTILELQPDILNNSEKNISITELLKFKNINDAKKQIIDREVDAILRDSHTEHISWIEKKLNIKLKGDEELWKKFIEITERRNLLVHSDGVISEQYLSVCKKHNVGEEKILEVGQSLDLNKEYFSESIDAIFEFGIKLSQVVWRKLKPGQFELADAKLNSICYDLLLNHKIELSKKILDFATAPYLKPSSEEMRLYFIVNKAIALRDLNKKEEAKKLISDNDLSAVDDKFKLAAHVILEEFNEAVEVIEKIGPSEKMRVGYLYWPLFNDLRKTELFLKTYKKVFKKKFAIESDPEKLQCDMMVN